MRWYHVVLAGLFGATAGYVLAWFILYACTATVGAVSAANAVVYGTVIFGIVGGAIVGVALALAGRSGKPPTV